MQIKYILLSILFILSVLLFSSCKQQPTSLPENGQLVIEVTFKGEDDPVNSKAGKIGEFTGKEKPGLQKTAIKFTDIVVSILEGDSTEIHNEELQEQPDGTFTGTIDVAAGNDRIIEVKAFYNNGLIASGDTANVDILPGRSTTVGIELSFVAGIERQLITADTLVGITGNPLPEPIVAKVTDVKGNGVAEINVVFRVIQGEAFFDRELKSLIIAADSLGLVSAILFLGKTPGEILVQVSANDRSGDPLIGSPHTVVVIASSGTLDNFLVEASGGGFIQAQTAGVPFNVRIAARDANNNFATTFQGTVDISSTGILSSGGGTTATFTNGVLDSHSVTIRNTGNFRITATRTVGTESGTSNVFPVSAPAPVISSFDPIVGVARTPVTIRGNNFNFPPISLRVGNTNVSSFQPISSTEIRAIVPGGATSGPLIITTQGGTAQSPFDFIVARIDTTLNEVFDVLVTGVAATQDSIYVLAERDVVVFSSSSYASTRFSTGFDLDVFGIAVAETQGGDEFIIITGTQYRGDDFPEIEIFEARTRNLFSRIERNPNEPTPHFDNIVVASDGLTGYVTARDSVFEFSVSESPSLIGLSTSQIGTELFGIALSDDDNVLYVTDSGTGEILIIDTNSRMEENRFSDVGSRPRHIVVSKDGQFLYITNIDANGVLIVDPNDRGSDQMIPMVSGLEGLAMTPDGRLIFVALFGNEAEVSIIDVAKRKEAIRIPLVGSGPGNVAISPDGTRVYVTNRFSGSLTVIRID